MPEGYPPPSSLLPSSPRRPGELLERLDVSDQIRAGLSKAAGEQGVPLDVAASLVVEAELAVRLLAQLSVSGPEVRLDRAAAARRVGAPLSAAEADYLRALTQGRWSRESSILSLPLRLLPRVRTTGVEALVRTNLLRQALAWEAAAMLVGLNLTEWALCAGLARTNGSSAGVG